MNKNLHRLQERISTMRKALAQLNEGGGAIIDRRELEFDSDALLTVIILSADAQSRRPSHIKFGQNEIKVMHGSNRSVTLSSQAIGGLLIQYCIKMKIPIPYDARKSVRFTANSVILQFEKNFDEMPMQGMTWPRTDSLK